MGKAQIQGIRAGEWHHLALRLEGSKITALVDDQSVLSATDNLYDHGMVGLLAGQDKKKLSTPYFDNIIIHPVGAPVPEPTPALPGQSPIYGLEPKEVHHSK